MDERIGIIGGTGVYTLEGVEHEGAVEMDTPWGRPSGPIVLARLQGVPLAFLARHGEGHVFTPSEVPYAANIYAMKKTGVRKLISVSAVGSLKEKIPPRDFVVPDQLWDRTKGIRTSTFFGGGVVGHVSFGRPFCPCMRSILAGAAEASGARVHPSGSYICIEGPAFSTRAESLVHRAMGMDIVGMTAIPEAKLAREAGMCYATLAMVTDFDAWHDSVEEVTLDMVVAHMTANTALARLTLAGAVGLIASARFDCACRTAAANAILTAPGRRNPERMADLEVILSE